MTSITLPLKKFPGRIQQMTIFGGGLILAPLIFIITASFTFYLYCYLNPASLLSYDLFGLLPCLWGSISILYYTKRSCGMSEKLLNSNLSEVKKIFETEKGIFRKIVEISIIPSLLDILVVACLFVLDGRLNLFMISICSIISIVATFISILLGLSSARRTIAYIGFVSLSEAAFLLTAFWGLWTFHLVSLIASLLIFFSYVHHVDEYDLRKFFHKTIR